MPDVGNVPREAARNDIHGVDAQVVARAHETGGEPFGGSRDSHEAVMIEREIGSLGCRARLYLDERKDLSAPSDQIDFATRNPGALREDVPAVQPQPQGGEALGVATACLGLLPLHSDASSRARA